MKDVAHDRAEPLEIKGLTELIAAKERPRVIDELNVDCGTEVECLKRCGTDTLEGTP